MPADDMSLRNLFFLFLGYIPAADGSLLCSELVSDDWTLECRSIHIAHLLLGHSTLVPTPRPQINRSLTHMAKIPSVMPADDMSLRNLFFLFLGYIPAADGSRIFSL
jgi:hypothetical protein